MEPRHLAATVLLIFLCTLVKSVSADVIANNSELAEIFAMDQADREPGYDGIDWDVVGARDEKRRSRTVALLRSGLVRTSEDFLHAAYVFQHGDTVEEARLALSLSWIAASIDPDNDDARWMTASAWDRLMMRQSQPQWYGTQYQRFGDGEWLLYEVQEDAVNDEQRKALNVPPLNELIEHAKSLNDKSLE